MSYRTYFGYSVVVLGYVYTGPAEYLVGHIFGQLSSQKKRSLRHCVYTGPISQLHDMRSVSSKCSVLLASSQSIKQVGKRNKLDCKMKGSEIKYILADDKAFLLLVVMGITFAKFLAHSTQANITVKTKWTRGGK